MQAFPKLKAVRMRSTNMALNMHAVCMGLLMTAGSMTGDGHHAL